MTYGIGMICHNRAPMTRVVVANLLDMVSSRDVPVVVVDDASTDHTAEVLEGFGKRIEVRRNKGQKGAYFSYNLAMRTVFEDYGMEATILLDNDLLAPPFFDWLLAQTQEKLVRILAERKIAVGSLVCDDRNVRKHLKRHSMDTGKPYLSNTVGGGHCVLIPRQMFDDTGGFPEKRPSFTFGDAAFYGKARQRGWQTWIDPRVVAFALDWHFYVDDQYEMVKIRRRYDMACRKARADGNEPMPFDAYYEAKMRHKSRIANE